MKSQDFLSTLIVACTCFTIGTVGFDVSSSILQIKTEVGQWTNFSLIFSRSRTELLDGGAGSTIEVINVFPDSLEVYPTFIEIYSRNFSDWEHTFHIRPSGAGKFDLRLSVVSSSELIRLNNSSIHIDVIRSRVLEELSSFCWIISYTALFLSVYPQLIANHLRRSTTGLNSDYMLLSIFSFSTSFSWILSSTSTFDHIQAWDQYISLNLLDLLLPLNGAVGAIFLLLQAAIFNKKYIEISKSCKVFLSVIIIVVLLTFTCTNFSTVYNYYLVAACYILALVVNCVRYFPQILQNYVDKSSQGWCLWTSVMESVGLVLAIVDLFVLKYNYNDLAAILNCDYQFWLRLWIIVNHVVLIVQNRYYRSRPTFLQISLEFDDYLYLYKETA